MSKTKTTSKEAKEELQPNFFYIATNSYLIFIGTLDMSSSTSCISLMKATSSNPQFDGSLRKEQIIINNSAL
jgi:hypothetical protein